MHMVYKVAFTLMLASSVLGCSSYRSAQPNSLDADLFDGIREGRSLTLVNAQPSTRIVEVGSAGLGRSIDANYNQWTAAAIDVLKSALNKRGIETTGGSDKSLELSLDRATLISTGGGFGFKCSVHLNAQTSGGYTTEFLGERGSWKFVKACDAAITEAVAVMLKDERIKSFLNN